MPDLNDLLFALPWLALLVAMPFLLRRRVRLSAVEPVAAEQAPLVSIIVPARNEAPNISACLATLLNSLYARREIIVVDDDSSDSTGDIVRILAEHTEQTLELVQGEPLPDGWLGKAWACWQGARRARGEVLLFTDADTRHDDMLLGHAVGALVRHEADLVSILPHQLMVGFWERAVLPQVFMLIIARYHDLPYVNRTRKPHDVLANGQFLLIRRTTYDAIGGHEAVRAEIVEDQRIAQRVVTSGGRLFLAHASDLMETRMYRSLGGIIEGWSKNVALGAKQSVPRWLAPLLPWAIIAFVLLFWVFPPTTLLLAALAGRAGGLAGWSLAATFCSLLLWLYVYTWMRVSPRYALIYPLGALVTAAIFLRSGLRGPRVAWKGRDYVVDTTATPTGSHQHP